MTVYSFFCDDCGTAFDIQTRYDQLQKVRTCPAGHKHVRRVYAAPVIVFKGSGFYRTDHRNSRAANGSQSQPASLSCYTEPSVWIF